jgi:hypothetical protein
MIKKLLCGFIAIIVMAGVATKAGDAPGIEVRKRNAIGRLGLVNLQVALKTEADGSLMVSFQAPEEGTYVLVYTSGPNIGKTATRLNVAKPGPVTTKIKPQP